MPEKIEIREILADDISSRTDPLEEVRQKFRFHIELTLNFPRTTLFVNSLADKQKSIYMQRYNIILNVFSMFSVVSKEHHFEYCNNGHIHFHALITYEVEKMLYPIGVVSDIVKCWLRTLPKKYSNYQDACMHAQYLRYRSPSICCQFVSGDNIERLNAWREYINKNSKYNI